MKIIGSKDYYDYLIGVYGIDDAVVIDRRESVSFLKALPVNGRHVHPISVAFCGSLYSGVIDTKLKQGWWGHDITKFCEESVPKALQSKWRYRSSNYSVYHGIDSNGKSYEQYITKTTEPARINDELACPLIVLADERFTYYGARNRDVDHWRSMLKHPLELAQYGFAKVVEPDVAYKTVYSWLIERNNEADVNVLSDKEKIEAKGFDKRVSFRHRK